MSQAGMISDGTSPLADVETLTGNVGGPVGPDAAFNINVVGGGAVTITGNPATNTLTAEVVVTQHDLLVGGAANNITGLALTNGQLPIGSTGADPVAATLTAGTGISITNGPGSITIDSTAGEITWQTVGASQALVVNNGYICTAGAALSFSLPAASAVGSTISLTLDGSTSWTVTQGAGQQIRFGSSQTTLGVGGSLASTAQGDTITMVCSVADTRWNVINSVGNITVV